MALFDGIMNYYYIVSRNRTECAQIVYTVEGSFQKCKKIRLLGNYIINFKAYFI